MRKKRIKPDITEIREYQTKTSGLFFVVDGILFRKQSEFQLIEVVENRDYGKILFLDGLVQTTERDEYFYHEMLVHPAFGAHPGPKDVLIIGGGDGGTLREVLRHPVERAVLVEIDPDVIEAAKKYFEWLGPALDDNRAELIVADGIRFAADTDRTFDLVFVDSSEPIGPSSVLHTPEFYQRLRERLNPGGIISSQIGSPFFHAAAIDREHRFLRDIFRIVRLYTGPVPTYPGGTWSYVFLSDTRAPLPALHPPPAGLKYFNPAVHEACFRLNDTEEVKS
ncbi:MAG: polyamine aminopropyltransferase [Acidobacteria bacterium]|nr:polyamine aminopropyltransferase [Acidobacteriota bacterium]